jgi:hypothetical protein
MKETWRRPLLATGAVLLALGASACGATKQKPKVEQPKSHPDADLPFFDVKSHPDGSITYQVGDGWGSNDIVKLYCEGEDLITILTGGNTNGDIFTRSIDDPRCPGKLAVSSILH